MFRLSRQSLFVPSQREVAHATKDTIVPSLRYMLQAGMITQNAGGLYTLLPLAQRSLEKLIAVVDKELVRIGCQKITLPTLCPVTLWKKSGRWESYGGELFRLHDRKNAEFCLAPTQEEAITDVVSHHISSYRHLPLRLYQSGPKFRDEIRPRFGLMRAREFWMKDLYTFDESEEMALRTYEEVTGCYNTIFRSIELPVEVAEADSGNIGGKLSHEFHVPTDIGEDSLLACSNAGCSYAANIEKADGRVATNSSAAATVSQFYVVQAAVASLIHVIHRKSHTVNIHKVCSKLGADIHSLKVASGEPTQFSKAFVCVDQTVENYQPFLKSVTQEGADEPVPLFGDFQTARKGDGCPMQGCSGMLTEHRGVEVGHSFFLGAKYSKQFQAKITNALGTAVDVQMGCYGLGLTRILSAAAEYYHDSYGLCWPVSIAPYAVVIIVTSPEKALLMEAACKLYDEMQHQPFFQQQVVLDERSCRVGEKLKDADLIGYPWQIIVGKHYLKEGKIELKVRRTNSSVQLKPQEAMGMMLTHLRH